MHLTHHAIQRLQQRGIPQSVSEVIYEFGEPVNRPGGALAYRLQDRVANELIQDLKRTITQIDKARKKTLIVDDHTGSVLTGYHNSKNRR